MNIKLLSLICGLAILTASCKKDNTSVASPLDSTIADLVVPANFTWHTARDVNFSIGITDTRFQNGKYVIAVYLSDPAIPVKDSDGNEHLPNAVAKGAANLVSPYNTKVSVPATVNDAFIVKIAADGSSITQNVKLASQMISISLGSSAVNNIKLPGGLNSIVENTKLTTLTNTTSTFSTVPTVTDVEPGCGTTVTNTKTTTSLSPTSSSAVTCFNSSIDVSLAITANNGGTIKLNAPGKTITVTSFSHADLKLYISAGTTVVFSSSVVFASSEKLVNNGTFKTSGLTTDVAMNGTYLNNGTSTFSGDFIAGSTAVIINSSVMNLQDVVINGGGISNNKTFTATSLTVNTIKEAYGVFQNQCYTNITGLVTVNTYSSIKNYNLMVVKNTVINSVAAIFETDGAMYQTDIFTTNAGYVYGTGEVSLFKVVTSVSDAVVENSGNFLGNIQYCGSKNIDASNSHFTYGAVQACGLYIPKDECNTLGNGTAPAPIKPDTDGDGIIDEQDAYPNDKTKAFNNYSVNYQNGGSTVAFEDSWPSQGDYDLNDVVMTYKHLVITNAINIVVHIEGQWNLVATGGEFQNGAAIQFPLPKGNITNFTASTGLPIEAGQDSLVVPLFTNSRALQSTWNTINGQAVSPTKSFTFSFDVTNGPTIAAMGVSSYNPFIWNNSVGFGRGYETHLYGENPTKLANPALFNSKADNSNKGISWVYYSTATKLPWGIELPVADFQYPLEYKPISIAYLKFNSWAISGGLTDKDWYSNTGVTYRNLLNFYTGK
jgi:LruC domain-containing protein